MIQNKNNGALSNIKVIDLTRVLSGPFCTMLLADMGAEVIKIEPPKGDNVRNQGDMIDGYSSYFAQFNRNKKSVILDLYKETDKDILKSLLSDADEQQIIDTFSTKEAIDDFSVVLSYEEIATKKYSLSAGQYFDVKIKYTDISENDFKLKMESHQKIIKKIFPLFY